MAIFKRYALIFFVVSLCFFSFPHTSFATFLVDDFESYADDAAVQATWLNFGIANDEVWRTTNAPDVHSGSQAMYEGCTWEAGGWGAGCSRTFAIMDLSTYEAISWWAKYQNAVGPPGTLTTIKTELVETDGDVWSHNDSFALNTTYTHYLATIEVANFFDGNPGTGGDDSLDLTQINGIQVIILRNGETGYENVFIDDIEILEGVPPPPPSVTIIDDFETAPAAYNAQGNPSATLSGDTSLPWEGTTSLNFSFAGADGTWVWQGMWHQLPLGVSLESANEITTYFRGDGTRHRVKIGISTDNGSTYHFSPDFYISTTGTWEAIKIPFTSFINDIGTSYPLSSSETVSHISMYLPADDVSISGAYAKQFFKAGGYLNTDLWEKASAEAVNMPAYIAAKPRASDIALTWEAAAGVNGYRIYKSVDNGAYSQLTDVGSGTLFTTDSSVTNGNSYQYKICGLDGSNNESPHSNPANFITYGSTFPLNYSEGKEGIEVLYYKHGSYVGEPTDVSYDPTTYPAGKTGGTQSYKATISGFTPGQWCTWQMQLPNKVDLSDFEEIDFWFRGDGFSNQVRFVIFAPYAANPVSSEAWRYQTDISLSNTSWQKITIPYAQMVWDNNSASADVPSRTFDGTNINRYGFTYLDSNTSDSSYNIDMLEAAMTAPPPPPPSISASRESDAAGSNIILSWTGGPADIYTTSSYATAEAGWNIWQTNVGATSTSDAAVVGDGAEKYYKVVAAGTSKATIDFMNDTVGKFDLQLTEGWNLVCLPLVPVDNSISNVFGDQLTSGLNFVAGDNIYGNFNGTSYERAWLSTTGWRETGGSVSTMQIHPDVGYWIYIAAGNGSANITVTGTIAATARSITINSGWNLVGSAYPLNPQVVNYAPTSGNGATSGINFVIADNVYGNFDGTSYERAWLHTTGWQDTGGSPSAMQFGSGKGIWYYKTGATGFTWPYNRPY